MSEKALTLLRLSKRVMFWSEYIQVGVLRALSLWQAKVSTQGFTELKVLLITYIHIFLAQHVFLQKVVLGICLPSLMTTPFFFVKKRVMCLMSQSCFIRRRSLLILLTQVWRIQVSRWRIQVVHHSPAIYFRGCRRITRRTPLLKIRLLDKIEIDRQRNLLNDYAAYALAMAQETDAVGDLSTYS